MALNSLFLYAICHHDCVMRYSKQMNQVQLVLSSLLLSTPTLTSTIPECLAHLSPFYSMWRSEWLESSKCAQLQLQSHHALLDNFVCSDTKLENLLFEVNFDETLK